MTAKALPFEERNQRDFDEMTARIRDSLDVIRKNRTLKATQDTLAGLAKCSRRTLNLRVWPILELNKIKDARSNHIKGDENKAVRQRTGKTDSLLIKQIKNYQTQNGQLFDRVQSLDEEKARSAVVVCTLENQLQVLKEKFEALEKEARRRKLRTV